MKKNKPIHLVSYEDIVGVSDIAGGENELFQCPLNILVEYAGQPFKPYSEERLSELAEDIKANGVLAPIIIRPFEDGKYQILAGHNRVRASRLAGLDKIPAIVKEVDDDTAKLIVVNTNLNQRDKLTYREKAYAYKMQLEAMKRQGKRSDLTSAPMEPKLRSDEELAEKVGESRPQIQRYIRLTYLNDGLLDMIDDGYLPFRAGVHLSYLSVEEQAVVYDYLQAKEHELSVDHAEQLKKQSQAGEPVTVQSLQQLLHPEKPPKAPKEKTVAIKIPAHLFSGMKKLVLNEEKLQRLAAFLEELCEE